MTIKSRLILVIGMLSVLLIGVGSLGVYGLNQTNGSFKGVYEDRAVPLGDLGLVLFREYALPFEVSSILLLTAMVGTVMLGKKEIN